MEYHTHTFHHVASLYILCGTTRYLWAQSQDMEHNSYMLCQHTWGSWIWLVLGDRRPLASRRPTLNRKNPWSIRTYVYIYIFIHMPHTVFVFCPYIGLLAYLSVHISMASHQSKLKHPFFECFCFCFCFCLFASVSFLPISCHLLVWVCIHRAFCSTHGSWLAGACAQDISATADAGARSRSLHSWMQLFLCLASTWTILIFNIDTYCAYIALKNVHTFLCHVGSRELAFPTFAWCWRHRLEKVVRPGLIEHET